MLVADERLFTVSVVVPAFPAASRAVNVMTFVPACSATVADQMLVPVAVVSKAWLEKLPPDLRDLVINEGRKLQARVQDASFSALDVMRKKWADQGGTIIRLPAEEQKKLFELLKPVGDTVTKSNPSLNEYYKSVLAVAAKH